MTKSFQIKKKRIIPKKAYLWRLFEFELTFSPSGIWTGPQTKKYPVILCILVYYIPITPLLVSRTVFVLYSSMGMESLINTESTRRTALVTS